MSDRRDDHYREEYGMKCRPVLLLLFLFGGAIVNVAVAWGCAAFVPNGAGVDYLSSAGEVRTTSGRTLNVTAIYAQQAGWPARSLAWNAMHELDTEQEALPLRPLWPGFAINTVFYAFVLWLLFAGPFVLRRRARIERGLCPKCAYDLRGSKDAIACPECGVAVVPPSAQTAR